MPSRLTRSTATAFVGAFLCVVLSLPAQSALAASPSDVEGDLWASHPVLVSASDLLVELQRGWTALSVALGSWLESATETATEGEAEPSPIESGPPVEVPVSEVGPGMVPIG